MDFCQDKKKSILQHYFCQECLFSLSRNIVAELSSLTHFDVISRSHALIHAYFSRISTLLEGNSTVLAVRSGYNCKIPSIEGVNVPSFNTLVRLRRFDKSKTQKFSGRELCCCIVQHWSWQGCFQNNMHKKQQMNSKLRNCLISQVVVAVVVILLN